jgi:hypothetical protein
MAASRTTLVVLCSVWIYCFKTSKKQCSPPHQSKKLLNNSCW